MKYCLPFILLILTVLTGCSNYVLIERNENANRTAGELKIICIDPAFYFEQDEENYDLMKREKINTQIRADIIKFSKKNKIDLSLYHLNDQAKPTYFNELLALKNDVLSANFKQQTPYNFYQKRKNRKAMQKKVFVYPPKISYDFGNLSKNYGTPYFSYLGVYQIKGNTVLYHIVVDTELSETVYREYKSVKNGYKQDLIGQMIYDSYAMVKKELMKNDR